MGTKSVTESNPLDMELLCAAMIAFPNNEDCRDFLLEHNCEVSEAKMNVYRRRAASGTSNVSDVYQKQREQLAPRLEAKLADDMLSNAQRATLAEGYCIEAVEQKLKMGEVKDPARVARDLSQIRTQAIDKRLALQGRPTAITEHRSVDELARSLVGLGVAELVEGTAEEDG